MSLLNNVANDAKYQEKYFELHLFYNKNIKKLLTLKHNKRDENKKT